MTVPRLILCSLLLVASSSFAAPWQAVGNGGDLSQGRDPIYATRTAVRPTDGTQVRAHLVFFSSRDFRLEVVDLGDGPTPAYGNLRDAFRANHCLAGVNGGFFHGDWRPSGLVIAGGRRINRFESAKLLSGVVYSDDRGIHLLRRSKFRDHPGITALLQSGPFLVEGGLAVRGLSRSNPDRRTFIATDWRGRWALGATVDHLTLAELAECLASPGALTPWRVDRALNLDGGSSTGFFFERGKDRAPIEVKPWKRVRNLLCIAPR